MNTSGENLILKDIASEMKDAYLDYSMSVIAARALPDVRDGLKPVHRRILYTMYGNGLYPENRSVSVRIRLVTCWVSTIHMVTHPFMMRWFVWHRTSPCAIRWFTDTETSVRWMETLRLLTDTPSQR